MPVLLLIRKTSLYRRANGLLKLQLIFVGLVLTLLLGWKLGDSIVPADLSPLMRGALLWCWRLVAPLLIAGILVRGLL